ncbi:sulfotransferase [Sphingomonas rhizophila]|uniref:Sulfotransferase n=1 Tax=Sphingomonas rhizophila TaxID=2071607 RepID=A0A7G9SCG0_9SPHN|nr:sulfotransferase [Sphingomonas rhizophila]QNN65535.1 sulfotransferase [Sphingomonas rhizophila]
MKISDLPNFVFIVGAPRCGTTTLADWLKQHPRVCFPFVKEPHTFLQHDMRGMDDAELRPFVEREYLDRFYAGCGPERDTGVDGSVSYLYAPEMLLPALKLWPNAKFIIAVRDPMQMLPSLHARLKVTGDETIERFEDAWAAIPDRAAGRRIPRSTLEPRWLRYDEGGKFGTYVGQFVDMFGRDRCWVSVFDDLAADPQAHYQRMTGFLGLEPFADTDFSPKRESQGFRFGWLQRLLKRPPAFARNYLAGKKFRQREMALDGKSGDDAVTEKIFSIRKRILRWNKVPLEKQVIPIDVQMQIREQLTGEVATLGRLIERDLSHWLEVREGRKG